MSTSLKWANWMKKNLFQTPMASVTSILLTVLMIKVVSGIFNWLFIEGVWLGSAETCRESQGACMAFIYHKFTYLMFGFYPKPLLWRPIMAIILLFGLIFWTKEPKRWSRHSVFLWGGYFILAAWLMKGGFFMAPVEVNKWGGFPLTLMLASLGFIFAYPLGIILALMRRSRLPLYRWVAVLYIELIRGVPLISLLFMSSVMLPLFLPEGITLSKLLRAQIALILFIAAYLAEVFRGGLQAIPRGQYEAAQSLGLNYIQTLRFVVLPQALKMVIPPTVNTVIGMFKDTSLVIIIALFDLMYTTKSSLSDIEWLGFSLEAYLFAATIYFICCFGMSRYSKRLEDELGLGQKLGVRL